MAISTQDLFEMSKRLTVRLSNAESDEVRSRIQKRRGRGGGGNVILENGENENWTTTNTATNEGGGGGGYVAGGGWIRAGAVDIMPEEVILIFGNFCVIPPFLGYPSGRTERLCDM